MAAPSTLNDCSGCAGMGAHRRWCPAVVGRTASMLGRLSEEAESLGDRVGPNEMAAANHLWAAAGLLREAASERALTRIAQDITREFGFEDAEGGGA